MSDVTAVKEALDFYENRRPRALNNWEALDRLADAARRYVHMIEEGREVKVVGAQLIDEKRVELSVDVPRDFGSPLFRSGAPVFVVPLSATGEDT